MASYLDAATEAERVYAFGEAGGYLERALELWARGRYDHGRSAIAAGLELVAGNDAWSTARLCAVGARLEVDRCIAAHARRARTEEAAARRRADELMAAAVDIVGPGEIEALGDTGAGRVPPARWERPGRLAG
jgi:hypothetical protein